MADNSGEIKNVNEEQLKKIYENAKKALEIIETHKKEGEEGEEGKDDERY